MTKTTLAALLASLAIPATAFALTVGETMSTDMDELRTMFEAEGFTVLEIEMEDGEIEIEYEKDGMVFEADVDAETGMLTGIEIEDDEDDDD